MNMSRLGRRLLLLLVSFVNGTEEEHKVRKKAENEQEKRKTFTFQLPMENVIIFIVINAFK